MEALPAGSCRTHWNGRITLLIGAAILIGSATPASAAPARHHAANGAVPYAAPNQPRVLMSAARTARREDRTLVRDARALKSCRQAHPGHCVGYRRAVQRAGARFARAQHRLTKVAGATSGSAKLAHAAHRNLREAPWLKASGQTLSWSMVGGMQSYVLVRRVPGQMPTVSIVHGRSTTPPPVPGVTVSYWVRTTALYSRWSRQVTISYPAPVPQPPEPVKGPDLQAAPALSVAGQGLSWNAVGGLNTYILAIKVPGLTDQYTEVTGTSLKPTPVPGKTVRYAVRTAVEGSSWSTEVAIAFPAISEPPPPPPPPPSVSPGESPRPGSGGLSAVGIDTGGWAGSLISELLTGGINYFRVHSGVSSLVASQAPGHIASIVFGEGGSIGSINPAAYAAEVVSTAARLHPLAVEVLNEPHNPGFWGDPNNFAAYAQLAKAVHEGLASLPAASRPAELCAWDGGEGPNSSWGAGIKAAGALPYCDGVTVHPYGGSSGQDGGAAGGHRDVETAHAATGLPVYVTEVGWPTAVGQPSTGDSQQWSEAQQAENMKNFVSWAGGTGYVKMVIFFNAVDYGSNTAYGIETASRKHKLSFATLAALS